MTIMTEDVIVISSTPADLVRTTRQELGYSQTALADLAGCSQTTVSRIESGHLPVAVGLTLAFESLLNIPREDLRPDVFGSRKTFLVNEAAE